MSLLGDGGGQSGGNADGGSGVDDGNEAASGEVPLMDVRTELVDSRDVDFDAALPRGRYRPFLSLAVRDALWRNRRTAMLAFALVGLGIALIIAALASISSRRKAALAMLALAVIVLSPGLWVAKNLCIEAHSWSHMNDEGGMTLSDDEWSD